METAVFWFRRDLRLHDNAGLAQALQSGMRILPVFIFDSRILDELPPNDSRVFFIFQRLKEMDGVLKKAGSSLYIRKGNPIEVWKALITTFDVKAVFTNRDYEPYATRRDSEVDALLRAKNIPFRTFKDQVIFEQHEVVKDNGQPYTVFTPFKKKWLHTFEPGQHLQPFETEPFFDRFLRRVFDFPEKEKLGIQSGSIKVRPFQLDYLQDYGKDRDFPARDAGSYLGPHLRFGTVSIRKVMSQTMQHSQVFLSELIWREFFMQILFHYPHVVNQNFKTKYDNVPWQNDPNHFQKWCDGQTGYPLVDAGMRQLNQTGYMHNRVRMVTASFLCKHLLIDWRWGEAYFAQKLLDYELSSNNGNWQWAAGTGCDAAPYFRVFNPTTQLKKFDPDLKYVRKWVSDLDEWSYPAPIVDHAFARTRAIETYKKALSQI